MGSQEPRKFHYTAVDFRPPSAPEVDPYHLVRTKGTLRDAPNKFVVGNVAAGWHVHTTTQRLQGWT